MSELTDAAAEVHRWLRERDLPHYFVGGLAVQVWGEARFTRDFDVCVVVPPEDVEGLMRQLLQSFQPRFDGADEIGGTLWVLPLVTPSAVPFDVTFALLAPETEMANRAVEVEMAGGQTLPVCCAEDLVVYKSNADRGKDAFDLEGILARQNSRLDVGAIRERLQRLCAAIEDSAPLERFERAWQQWAAETEGEAVGIDDNGYLLLRKDNGFIESVSAGEVIKCRPFA